jgi:malonyl-CoA O-methyltransferase
MPATERPPTIDPQAAARWERAAPAASPWLHEEVARRMEDRLQWIRLRPKAWAHWGAVRGGLQAQALLARRYPDAEFFVVETPGPRAQAAMQSIAKPWWSPARWTTPAAQLRLPPDAGVQMLWANMALHLAADPQALIAQWHRALAPEGFLMFSCLGPDTARELRGLYRRLGWPAAGHEFTDMHDWGDMLVHAGFAEPVMDMERIVLTYESPAKLLQDLRELGRNLHPQRFAGLRGRAWRQRLERELAQHLADPREGGRLSLTFEIIYGHALKPQPRVKLSAQSAVSLQDMRAMLQGARPDADTAPTARKPPAQR